MDHIELTRAEGDQPMSERLAEPVADWISQVLQRLEGIAAQAG